LAVGGENLPYEKPESRRSRETRKNSKVSWRIIVFVTVALLVLIGLYQLSQYNYLLFHSSSEIFTVVIAFAIFAIAWNSRNIIENKYLLFIGIAFLFVAGLDILHMLTYKNMNVFPSIASNPNVATQLWIAMRYMFAFSLVIPLLLIKRKIRPIVIFGGYGVSTALLFLSIFYWHNFPVAYDYASSSLTGFKVVSELIVSLILFGAIVLLAKYRNEFSKNIFTLLAVAIGLGIATEMSFTLYTDVFGIANMTGHLLNIVSVYFVYRALVETGLKKPYELMFHNLKRSEESLAKRAVELSNTNVKLEQEIAEREAIEEALRENEEHLRLKLDSVLSPDVKIEEQELTNVIDVPTLQTMMENLYAISSIGFALVDLKGNILVGTGWQDICTQFHRTNPISCKNCLESDLELSKGVKKGEIHLYKCKNNMWDVVTPLFIGEKHVANVFFGQFFFEGEEVDRELFTLQAEKYGFDEEKYLEAFDRVPRYTRSQIDKTMKFYAQWSEMISKLSFGNLKLAKLLVDQKALQLKLEEKAAEVEEYASRMEELAEERARRLKDAERLATIGQTAGMVGHDIRNPLQAIATELYLEKLETKSLPEGEIRKNLEENINGIEQNLFYINKIVADLQDFARPLKPKKEPVDLNKVLHESLEMISIPQAVNLNVSTEQESMQLCADATMLKRILVNLVQNAVQAMPNGGLINLKAEQKGNLTVIRVQDNGEGIPEEAKEKLFTPLFTTKAKGQGFGLAVVKRLVEAQGGKITFESQRDQGTTFTLEFPKQ
jgi:signal transduction histidine kinase